MSRASAVTGVTGYFASTTVASLTGLDLPAWVYMIVGLVLMTMFAYFHIELTAKVLGVRVSIVPRLFCGLMGLLGFSAASTT